MKTAIYAGTFDPITMGHLSVIEDGSRLFDRLIVLIAINPKKDPLFTVAERLEMIREATSSLSNVTCASTGGYVVEYAKTQNASFLLRGVRDATDAAYETSLAQMNHTLAPNITTIFIPAHPELSKVSSSQLKKLAKKGAELTEYCPPTVEQRLLNKLQGKPNKTDQGVNHATT